MKRRATDVAEYILQKCGAIPAMKLQKLVYYSQAWALVWDDEPLFSERIEAWANGPVVRDLYAVHRLQYLVETVQGDSERLTVTNKETIDAVLDFYGDKSSQWLSDLTHDEEPWQQAREGIPVGDRSTVEITPASMAEYYGGL